jgi:hypothetical protein
MKRVLMILNFLSLGCGVSEENLPKDVTTGDTPLSLPHRGPASVDGGIAVIDWVAFGSDVAPDVQTTHTADALTDVKAGYTAAGVTASLGTNLCADYYKAHGSDAVGWLPASVVGGNGACYTSEGVCGSKPSCGTYAPGTLYVWDTSNPRYRYLGDSSGGYVCLPNNNVYTVSCN